MLVFWLALSLLLPFSGSSTGSCALGGVTNNTHVKIFPGAKCNIDVLSNLQIDGSFKIGKIGPAYLNVDRGASISLAGKHSKFNLLCGQATLLPGASLKIGGNTKRKTFLKIDGQLTLYSKAAVMINDHSGIAVFNKSTMEVEKHARILAHDQSHIILYNTTWTNERGSHFQLQYSFMEFRQSRINIDMFAALQADSVRLLATNSTLALSQTSRLATQHSVFKLNHSSFELDKDEHLTVQNTYVFRMLNSSLFVSSDISVGCNATPRCIDAAHLTMMNSCVDIYNYATLTIAGPVLNLTDATLFFDSDSNATILANSLNVNNGLIYLSNFATIVSYGSICISNGSLVLDAGAKLFIGVREQTKITFHIHAGGSIHIKEYGTLNIEQNCAVSEKITVPSWSSLVVNNLTICEEAKPTAHTKLESGNVNNKIPFGSRNANKTVHWPRSTVKNGLAVLVIFSSLTVVFCVLRMTIFNSVRGHTTIAS